MKYERTPVGSGTTDAVNNLGLAIKSGANTVEPKRMVSAYPSVGSGLGSNAIDSFDLVGFRNGHNRSQA